MIAVYFTKAVKYKTHYMDKNKLLNVNWVEPLLASKIQIVNYR
jgi:hypothetical protein